MHAPHVQLIESFKQARYREHFLGLPSWQTKHVFHTDVRTVFVTGVHVAETCSAQGRLREQPSPLMPQRGPPRVFGDYVPCGACTGLVHRSQLQGLTPEETHHSKEEVVAFDQFRQMERDRIGNLNREKTLGLIPPEEPVRADYGTASQVKRKPAKSKLGELEPSPPVSLSPRTGSEKHGKQKHKPRRGTARNHKVSKKPAKER